MKSPLKGKPLNNPGQSLEVRLNDIAVERVYFPLTISILFLYFAIYEWNRWYFEVELSPILWSVLAICVLIYSVWKIIRAFKEIKLVKRVFGRKLG